MHRNVQKLTVLAKALLFLIKLNKIAAQLEPKY